MKYLFSIIFLLLVVIMAMLNFRAHADEVGCLALNIYHEARNQPLVGKLAVGLVTLNRVKDVRFPNTICGVVYQGSYSNNAPIKNRCHFSWWCDGKSDKPKDLQSWHNSLDLSQKLYEGFFDGLNLVRGATHYHATYVTPYWAYKKKKVKIIADHVFYRWEK